MTSVNQIEITETGAVQIRFAKRIVESGKVLSTEWHRTCIDVGRDVVGQIAAVNAHLLQMGWPELPADTATTIAQYTSVAWTPEIVAAFQQQLAQALPPAA